MVTSNLLGVKRRLYMVTISAQQKSNEVTKTELDDVIFWLSGNTDIIIPKRQIVYENTGRYNQLHIHCLAWLSVNAAYSPYTKYGDLSSHNSTFRIQWVPVNTIKGAITYLTKTVTSLEKQSQIFDENHYMHNYGFTKNLT